MMLGVRGERRANMKSRRAEERVEKGGSRGERISENHEEGKCGERVAKGKSKQHHIDISDLVG